ncbi:hypothetical protein [Hufsiella ginkgonis]|uniref:Outer membrane beta-barrel protein n=1 Tax=Hufsiella ginkgonis TaxID=2695274 RepID=A0A7K1XYG6_9SPHI|nr:hypothetical protein [Hufsiella ginkgonis]MXV15586.1 hypothetical protein [Hufsiella ginkgonis]
MDPFDKKLADHIRDVFDDYSEDGAAEGWQELRKKYPERDNRRPLVWWLSSAAAILVVGAATWLSIPVNSPVKKTGSETAATKYNQPSPAPGDSSAHIARGTVKTATLPAKEPGNMSTKTTERSALNKSTATGPVKIANAANRVRNKENTIIKPEEGHPDQVVKSPAASLPTSPDAIAGVRAQVQLPYLPGAPVTSAGAELSPGEFEKILGNRVASLDIIPAIPVANNSIQPAVVQPLTSVVVAHTRLQGTLDSARALPPLPPAIARTIKQPKFPFGIYAASFFSYANGSTSQLNLSAGITSDFKLSPRLKLSTGIGLARNDLSFERGVPQSSSNLFSTAANPAQLAQNGLYGNSGQSFYLALDSYDAHFIGLDLPVNLKYTFPQRKYQFFMSAGLSSYTFIDEKYVTSYSVITPGTNAGMAATNLPLQETVNKSFSTFDVAGTLNLSVGFGYPVGKKAGLSVEPFLKYPLKGMGYEKIPFGSGGVSLKFNFNRGK